MARRKKMFVSWGRVPPAPCPACRSILRSATGLSPRTPVVPRAGTLTLCDRCQTWLAFTPGLGLRRATTEEIASLDSEMQRLAEKVVEHLSTRDPKH